MSRKLSDYVFRFFEAALLVLNYLFIILITTLKLTLLTIIALFMALPWAFSMDLSNTPLPTSEEWADDVEFVLRSYDPREWL